MLLLRDSVTYGSFDSYGDGLTQGRVAFWSNHEDIEVTVDLEGDLGGIFEHSCVWFRRAPFVKLHQIVPRGFPTRLTGTKHKSGLSRSGDFFVEWKPPELPEVLRVELPSGLFKATYSGPILEQPVQQ